MAFVTTIFCQTCNRDKQVTTSGGISDPIICHECALKEEQNQMKMHFAGLKALSVEDRLEKLEQWMYEHKKTPHPRQISY
jgi:hypothetical protein